MSVLARQKSAAARSWSERPIVKLSVRLGGKNLLQPIANAGRTTARWVWP
jgi:hypothetical protein